MPDKLMAALLLTTAVAELIHKPAFNGIVPAPVKGTKVAAFGVDNLKVPLDKIKKLTEAVKELLVTSNIFELEVPMFNRI
jgi:hypothetical protein